MVDNQNDNEYEFSDLEMESTDFLDESEVPDSPNDVASYDDSPPKNNIIRNVAIVIAVIILGILAYEFIQSFYKTSPATTSLDTAITSMPPSNTVTPVAAVTPTPVVTLPQQPTNALAESSSINQINQKLADLGSNQQNLNTAASSINNQLNELNASITALDTKITALTQSLITLSNKLDDQTNHITLLLSRAQTAHVSKKSVKKVAAARLIYHIQAVIPGRAWLIASNGSTITVREGTSVNGYGIVKMIDPNQGRVLTSSGQVIRFSQHDS